MTEFCHGAGPRKPYLTTASDVEVAPLARQTASPDNEAPAAFATVRDLLPRAVAPHIVGVMDFWFQTEVAHRLPPFRTVSGRRRTVSGDGEQVRVFVPEGLVQPFAVGQDQPAESDSVIAVIGQSGRHPQAPPVDLWNSPKGKLRHEFAEQFHGELADFRRRRLSENVRRVVRLVFS